MVGDWNDNGQRKRIGIFRPSAGWILDTNGNNAFDITDQGGNGALQFGLPGDKPVVGKWTMP